MIARTNINANKTPVPRNPMSIRRWTLNGIEMSKSGKIGNREWNFQFHSRFHFIPDSDTSMPFNAHFLTRYILKSRKVLNINQWFIPSDFIKRISNYGYYGYNRLKRTSVTTTAPPLVDSKHYNSFPFSTIWVDPLWISPHLNCVGHRTNSRAHGTLLRFSWNGSPCTKGMDGLSACWLAACIPRRQSHVLPA